MYILCDEGVLRYDVFAVQTVNTDTIVYGIGIESDQRKKELIRFGQKRWVEAIFSRSLGVWISYAWGPRDRQSKPGIFSLSRPHSKPAWIAITWGF